VLHRPNIKNRRGKFSGPSGSEREETLFYFVPVAILYREWGLVRQICDG